MVAPAAISQASQMPVSASARRPVAAAGQRDDSAHDITATIAAAAAHRASRAVNTWTCSTSTSRTLSTAGFCMGFGAASGTKSKR